jgi:chemotaxis family two-component system sensor kinase Cph1
MSKTHVITPDLERLYERSLGDYLLRGGEEPLQRAYELGRLSLAEGRSILDMIHLHHAALTEISRNNHTPELRSETIARASQFFAESMSSYEMSQRAVGEANAVLRKLNETLEEQVRRIAHALHDDAGQLMVAAHMSLDDAIKDLEPPIQERLREVKILLTRVDERIRDLSHELRPSMLDHLGLVSAVEFLAASVAQRAGLRITVRSSLRDRLPPQISITFYRIIQEALTNIRRHARASSVQIRFRNQGAYISCVVKDNGIGFDTENLIKSTSPGLGLLGIQERLNALGGKLNIQSAPGQGTALEFTAPVPKEAHANSNSSRRRSPSCA